MADEFEILYGGARGGGKTDAGMAWLLYEKDNPKYKGLVIRKNAEDLSDWIARAKVMYEPTEAKFVGNPSIIRFPSGSFIKTGHLKDENAYEKYLGHEYHKINIEELTLIPSEESYMKLISSCRSTVPELKPQVYASTNPGGAGHKWVKNRFRLSGVPTSSVVTKDPNTGRSRIFIPARIEDNPHLMKVDPSYVKMLESLPTEALINQWRYGSWDDFEIKGAYYIDELNKCKQDKRIKKVPYDPKLLVYTVWDLGVSDEMVIGFWQRTNQELRLIDYYHNNTYGLPHYIKIVKEKPYLYGKHFAPHDIKVTEMSSGKTRQQIAEELGLKFEVIEKLGLEDGINAVRMIFSRLWINEDLEPFIDAVRQYRKKWDEERGVFSDKPIHDWSSHPADMLRYTAVIEDKMTNKTQPAWTQPEYVPQQYEGTMEPQRNKKRMPSNVLYY